MDKDPELPRPGKESSDVRIHEEEATEMQARSDPLKSTFNSTFIVLVLSIAIILALILVFWPSRGFHTLF